MVLNDSRPAATFLERLTLMYALGHGYLLAQEQAINALAEHCEALNQLTELYRSVVFFNARYFFSQPIKGTAPELHEYWQPMLATLKIQARNQDLLQQADAVHRLLVEDQRARELEQQAARHARENRNVFLLSILGLVLAAPAILAVTPEAIRQFIRSWFLS